MAGFGRKVSICGASRLNQRHKVIIVDGSIAFTGAFKASINIAKSLAPWADTILVLPAGSKVGREHMLHFSQVVYVPMRQIRRSLRDLLLYVPSLLASSLRISKLLRSDKERTSILINDYSTLQGTILRLLGYKGSIITFVRFDPTRHPRLLSKFWVSAAMRSSDHLVAVSRFIAGRLPKSPKVRILYDYSDEAFGALEPRQYGRRDIVYISNYIPGKGHDHAITAFGLIADDYPNVRLLFYGGDMGLEKNKAFRRSMKARVDAMGLKHRVLFKGFINKVERAFVTAAVALNLSESESFSMTCLEASSLAIPVVAFSSGGPEEIVVDGTTGFLLNTGDVAGVAEALRSLLDDTELAFRMGCAGRSHVLQRFDRQRFQDKLLVMLNLCPQLLETRGDQFIH